MEREGRDTGNDWICQAIFAKVYQILLFFFSFSPDRDRAKGPLWLRRRGGGGRRKSPFFFFLSLRCGGVRKKGFCGLDSREGKSERGEGPTELDVVKIESHYLP